MAAMLILLAFAGCTGGETPKNPDTSMPDTSNEGDSNAATLADIDYVKNKGTLVVGITDFAPMDYKESGSDEWTGFDAELAKAFAESLGVKAEFIEIDWDNKIFELDAKKIDCIWNGMTITDELLLNTSCSNPYVRNKQVVVMAADKVADYADVASLAGLEFAVEAGSAGENAASDNDLTYTAVKTQADALMEVKAGTSDACIIDSTMASSMTGEGTDYADLAAGLVLADEEYGISFRKNSDLTAQLNTFLTEYEGLQALAEKYNLVLI